VPHPRAVRPFSCCPIQTTNLPCSLKSTVALVEIADSFGNVERIFFPAWEAGNEDHDAVHVLGLALAQRKGLLERSFQIPYYRAGSAWQPFRLFAPLA
jgi:hypothetical protein